MSDDTERGESARPRKGLTRRHVLAGTTAGAAALAAGGVGYYTLTRPHPTIMASRRIDVAIIGGGIMGATFGAMLRQVEPDWTMEMFERLDEVAQESSNVWHNAGTGHSALCEPNYTPVDESGTMEISQALKINEQFQVTRQFLSSMLRLGEMKNPRSFIHTVPHMGIGMGGGSVGFQQMRHRILSQNPLFAGMQVSTDHKQIGEWAPLLMEGRAKSEPLAATWASMGTDVNWGEVTRQLTVSLTNRPNAALRLSTEVKDIKRNPDGTWRIIYKGLDDDLEPRAVDARSVFIGAGGAALLLLQKTGIPEAADYAGFPVGGSFLVNEDPALAERHLACAYGKADEGSPPMSVPHLDTRFIDGQRKLAFGPFATFSTKFLKEGSQRDLFRSVTGSNLPAMVDVGMSDLGLVRYLVGEVLQTRGGRLDALRRYVPSAGDKGWNFVQAGQRVQIIKRGADGAGNLQFGTEVVTSADGTISALLGASPGASVAPSIMLDTLQRMFPERFASAQWQQKWRELIPSYGVTLNDNPDQLRNVWAYTNEHLYLSPAIGPSQS